MKHNIVIFLLLFIFGILFFLSPNFYKNNSKDSYENYNEKYKENYQEYLNYQINSIDSSCQALNEIVNVNQDSVCLSLYNNYRNVKDNVNYTVGVIGDRNIKYIYDKKNKSCIYGLLENDKVFILKEVDLKVSILKKACEENYESYKRHKKKDEYLNNSKSLLMDKYEIQVK